MEYSTVWENYCQISLTDALPRQLLEEGVQWHFEEHHEPAVKALKTMVTSSPVLAYYEPSGATRVTTDASKDGLGAILEQKHEDGWKTIAYASRAMT